MDDRLKARIQEDIEYDQLVNEGGKAVYVTSNPEELSEEWYMVGEEKDRNFSKKLCHTIIPYHLYDQKKAELEEKYGEVIDLGHSYELDTHHLGTKRSGLRDQHDIESMIKQVFGKEGFLQSLRLKLEAAILPDIKEEIANEIEFFSDMPEDEFNEGMVPIIAAFREETDTVVTEQEANNKIGAFYAMDFGQEKAVRARQAEKLHTINQYMKRMTNG